MISNDGILIGVACSRRSYDKERAKNEEEAGWGGGCSERGRKTSLSGGDI